MDLGDIAMPVIDHASRTTKYYPNSRFRLGEGKPVVIMLDEFTKGFDPVKNMLHPLLEATNPRLGDVSLDDDSIVFLTGNLSSDGVGDTLKAHSRNRITVLRVSKPDAEQWLAWAVDNDVSGVVMAWVSNFPHALASYLDDGQKENPYIYNPKAMQQAFVSPRSLVKASAIVANRAAFSDNALTAALKGCIGEAAARDMQAFIDYQDQLPAWDDIINTPKTAKLPDGSGAASVLIFSAVTKVDKATITPFMEYLARMDAEWQAVFATTLAKNMSKQAIAFSSKAFTSWAERNEDIL